MSTASDFADRLNLITVGQSDEEEEDIMQEMFAATKKTLVVPGRSDADGIVRGFEDGSAYDEETCEAYSSIYDLAHLDEKDEGS